MYRAMPTPSAELRSAFKAECSDVISADSSDGRVMQTAGGVAEIAVAGVLVKSPSFMMWLMGMQQTAYGDIINALAKASADASVKSVVLKTDSPGGSVDGLFETIAAIQAFDKPISAMCVKACSAAYAIAASTKSIVAASVASSFGSIGVAASIAVDDDVVDLTSTEAPEKRPDVTTPEGQAVVVRYLDAVHGLFADAIATGRKTTVEAVNKEYGRGSELLAADAMTRGMIDGIAGQKPRLVKTQKSASAESGGNQGDPMDLKTLKAQHADVFEAAAGEGAKTERDRVTAHLTMASHGGEAGLKLALAAIKSGDPLTMTLQAEYMTVALSERDIKNRQEESNTVSTATAGTVAVQAQDGGKDFGDRVADAVEAKLGISKVG
jgi:ClpP class serine protease